MADFGSECLWICAIISFYASAASLAGYFRRDDRLRTSGRYGVCAAFALLTLASVILYHALLTHDFSIEYVAGYTNRALPALYLFSAFWAGQAGSLLLWTWLILLFAILVLRQNRHRDRDMTTLITAATMGTAAFFFLLLILVSNPFERLAMIPPDGQGMNPILQNPGMIYHPPLTFLGYVGFTIPFAYAVAALIMGKTRLRGDWMTGIRRWTLFSWFFLGLGILTGAQWSYEELGCGGYWAWDPVENASFLPWLTGTAFLHTLNIQRKRGALKNLNLFLIILTFLLCIFGTFLTRSGIISSLHSFGTSNLGAFFIVFMLAVLCVSLVLLFYRMPFLRGDIELESVFSKESTFLWNAVILTGLAFGILLATMMPVLAQVTVGRQVALGPDAYNRFFVPLFLILIALTGFCSLVSWKRPGWRQDGARFIFPAVTGAAAGLILFALGMDRMYPLLAFAISAFVAAALISEFARSTAAGKKMAGVSYLRAFFRLLTRQRERSGAQIIHLGVVLMVIGIAGSSGFQSEREAVLRPGESFEFTPYVFRFDGLDRSDDAVRESTAANVALVREGRELARLRPEIVLHKSHNQRTSEVDIRMTLKEDVYVILAGFEADGSASFQFQIKPLVAWVWLGGIVLFTGTLLVSFRRGKKYKESLAT
jgi:cytochrome c-type biogenesis protein CcmF